MSPAFEHEQAQLHVNTCRLQKSDRARQSAIGFGDVRANGSSEVGDLGRLGCPHIAEAVLSKHSATCRDIPEGRINQYALADYELADSWPGSSLLTAPSKP